MTDETKAQETAEPDDTMFVQAEGRVHGFSERALPPGIAARMAAGEMQRVNEDGSPWAEPEDEDDEPAARAPLSGSSSAARSDRPGEPVVPPAHVPPPAPPHA